MLALLALEELWGGTLISAAKPGVGGAWIPCFLVASFWLTPGQHTLRMLRRLPGSYNIVSTRIYLLLQLPIRPSSERLFDAAACITAYRLYSVYSQYRNVCIPCDQGQPSLAYNLGDILV